MKSAVTPAMNAFFGHLIFYFAHSGFLLGYFLIILHEKGGVSFDWLLPLHLLGTLVFAFLFCLWTQGSRAAHVTREL